MLSPKENSIASHLGPLNVFLIEASQIETHGKLLEVPNSKGLQSFNLGQEEDAENLEILAF